MGYTRKRGGNISRKSTTLEETQRSAAALRASERRRQDRERALVDPVFAAEWKAKEASRNAKAAAKRAIKKANGEPATTEADRARMKEYGPRYWVTNKDKLMEQRKAKKAPVVNAAMPPPPPPAAAVPASVRARKITLKRGRELSDSVPAPPLVPGHDYFTGTLSGAESEDELFGKGRRTRKKKLSRKENKKRKHHRYHQ